ncbi:MAG: NAD(P)/FAD-dependent oxidoreductase [Hydrogenibacillus schlegelii]|nr:NAD(P)/FAD-dependent oxidoreductase [Hydrogenibacillus schlegelii]
MRESPLASAAGWVDVDKHTLQHTRHPNVFALGDVADGPTSKTGAAIRKQAPVLVENVLHFLRGEPLTACYNGYSSCPFVTGIGRLCWPSSAPTAKSWNRSRSTRRHAEGRA